MPLVPFLVSLVCTAAFVAGTWYLIKAMGGAKEGDQLKSAMYVVIGLGLKFPAAIFVLKFLISKDQSDRSGAIAAVILVYFSTVLGMTFKSLKENKQDL